MEERSFQTPEQDYWATRPGKTWSMVLGELDWTTFSHDERMLCWMVLELNLANAIDLKGGYYKPRDLLCSGEELGDLWTEEPKCGSGTFKDSAKQGKLWLELCLEKDPDIPSDELVPALTSKYLRPIKPSQLYMVEAILLVRLEKGVCSAYSVYCACSEMLCRPVTSPVLCSRVRSTPHPGYFLTPPHSWPESAPWVALAASTQHTWAQTPPDIFFGWYPTIKFLYSLSLFEIYSL